MQDLDIISKLNKSFLLTASQVKESSGKGYRINLQCPRQDNSLNVKNYHVLLCGTDPLTGRDVAEDGIFCRFDFSKKTHKTDVLTYHGTFQLRCTANLVDGREITFKEQEIILNYPQNAPYVKYQVSNKGEFRLVEIESNCWANCAEKIWLRFDGHRQRVKLPPRFDRTIRFYVPASGTVTVEVQDEMIDVRNGR